MSHGSYYKPSGIWANGDVPGAAFFTYLDQRLFKLIDGDGGGTWAPSAALTIGGSGIIMSGPLVISGADATLSSGKKITVTGSGSKIITASGGRFVLGDNDYPTFSAARSAARVLPANATVYTTMETTSGTSQQTAAGQLFQLQIPSIFHGATLLSAQAFFVPSSGYNGQPTGAGTQVKLGVARVYYNGGAVDNLLSTGGGLVTYPTPASGTAYYNAGAITSLTFSSDQNNVMDLANYYYFVSVFGEDGSNYHANTNFTTVVVTFANILDMRP